MPTFITRLSKFTIPIAGLNPQGEGLPTHNMISPAAGVRKGKRGKTGGGTLTWSDGKRRGREKSEGETKGWTEPSGIEGRGEVEDLKGVESKNERTEIKVGMNGCCLKKRDSS